MMKFFELFAFHVILISIRVTQIDLLLDNNVSNFIWSGIVQEWNSGSGIVRSGIVGVELSCNHFDTARFQSPSYPVQGLADGGGG